MNSTSYLLLFSSVGVILSAAAKVLWDTAFASWGIVVSASVFVFGMIHWIVSISGNKGKRKA
jgi:hypothetical protein